MAQAPNSISPWSLPRNQGGRKGGLSKEQAAQASAMRKQGACLRCRVFRVKCGEGHPCPQCQRRTRNWKLGCTRAGLEDHVEVMVSNMLTPQSDMEFLGGRKIPFHVVGPEHIFISNHQSKEPTILTLLERRRISTGDGLSQDNRRDFGSLANLHPHVTKTLV